jgi:GT2 family glycosyltransferase
MAAGRGAYLLCVNDDVEVSEGWFEPLLEALIDGAWCATPDMEHSDGPQIYAPYCALWRREAWHEMGGLDEQFRHWCSDIDMARRLVDAGHTPVKVKLPNPITHQTNGTAEEKPDIAGPVATMCADDLERFARKWGVTAEVEKYRLRDLVWP